MFRTNDVQLTHANTTHHIQALSHQGTSGNAVPAETEYKLAEVGGFYVESPTRKLNPSQRCAKCWELTPKTLADRVHHCQHCGHLEDRDVNAAQVNLIWAKGLGTSLLDADAPSSTAKTRKTAGSMRQLGQIKRQKFQQVGGSGETPSAHAVG